MPFEVRQQQELEGLIALEEKRYAAAAQAFGKANQQDPRILYLTAVALKGAGDTARAAAMAAKAAAFNQLSFNYGYVRAKARKMAGHRALTPSLRARGLATGVGSPCYTFKFRPVVVHPSCGSGGTGRRASLRSLFSQESGGSNPLFRTTIKKGPEKARLRTRPWSFASRRSVRAQTSNPRDSGPADADQDSH